MKTLVRTNNTLFPSLPSLIDNFFSGELLDSSLASNHTSSMVPAVNIQETNDFLKIEVAAPGLKREDFRLNLENDILTISSQREEERGEHNDSFGNYTRKEFSYQSFLRSFTLPEDKVEREKISARYADGILAITIPKRRDSKDNLSRQITIN
jgi:HSP20 family protein